ncbi:TRAP transporter substrate-binding protein [Maribacter sp. 1_2014MBL_MicDiv]|uniref:TRAP transporter substrate-binding protein n=1 Tax=Maribacter sp. 1_2014MBL_MicDiv TaxID=1644130 RepID=UPI0008F513BA|nr:TRAP transporter substrate-binding protein [Maribacter sp. 1_2014MBL_MicDiv]APA63171.1 C4-dicarboxylate ABC transporter [Maribacter sp. 1_2014MBL_MicDiv]
MFLKRIVRLFLSFMIISLMSCNYNDQEPYALKASLLVNEDHSWHKAFIFFGERLKEKSNGRLQLETFPSEQLAKEVEAIRMIQAGVLDMTTTSSLLSNWTEIMTFCELPFLLKTPDDVEILMQGPLGKRISKEMLEKTGLKPLGYFQAGVRQLTSNKPITHPDDLQGLILRVPNVPSFVSAWDALGAKTTPMAFSEVFTSLQQGTIDAQENPLALIKVSRFYEVQKYVNLTNHVVSWSYPVIGEKSFQKLPEDLKAIFLEASEEMITYHQQLFLENEKKIREELEAKGMVFVNVDNAAFIEKCGTTIYDTLSPEMQEIYNTVKQDLP